MRRFLFLALIMFLITGGILLYSGTPDIPVWGSGPGGTAAGEPYFLLYRALDMAEARVCSGELHYWAVLPAGDEPLTESALEARADALLKRLAPNFVPDHTAVHPGDNINSGSTPSPSPGSNTDPPDCILLEREGGLGPSCRLRLLLQGWEEEGNRTVHLFVLIGEEGAARHLGALAQRFPALLEGDVLSSSLTLSLVGRIPQKMEHARLEPLAREIAGRLGAQRVECIQEDYMVSLTGYTPLLKHVHGDGLLPVNFNLALRGEDAEEDTLIWVGTPLIAGMY